MRKLEMFVIALGLAAGACKGDTASRANRAANKVVDETKDLVEHQTRRLENAAGDIKEASKQARDVSVAETDFARRRLVRTDVLRAQHGILATQPLIVSSLASAAPLTDAGRADVNEKLQLFQMRIDETGNLIQELRATNAADFEARDAAATDAMQRLVEARDAAFKALTDGARADRSS